MASASDRETITPVILCGGAGTRLWPLSRIDRLKPMVNLTGAGTLLQLTARRVEDAERFAAPVLVAGMDEAEAIEGQLQEIGVSPGLLLLEPVARGTAAAIALAALAVEPEAVLLVMPSDHLIGDEDAFRAAVAAALPLAKDGWLVTFGIAADRAETGYGYIERGEALGDGAFAAARFVEKPDAATAEAFVAGGRHDWNAGMFLFRAGRMTEALKTHAPEVAAAAEAAVAGQETQGEVVRPAAEPFLAAPALSIDVAVMEKADRVAVVPAAIGWSDIGSFTALADAMAADGDGNATQGDVLAIDTQGCLIRSEGPLIATIGISDLVVVATADAVLIVPRDQAQRVREVVERLKAEGREGWT
jgi:mannose-1-phosphate guanylyltransferase